MMTIAPKIVFSFILILFINQLKAQNELTVSGVLKDSSTRNIVGATIYLIQVNDTLHTTSNSEGYFVFKAFRGYKTTLVIKALGYHQWSKEIEIPTNTNQVHLSSITLQVKFNNLKEIIVKGNINPITLNGDTIDYKVDQYKLKSNSVIEDLIKRLPGLEVDANGSISYLGRPITKIRLNGQEYLVPDIRTLTRILPTDILEKVQLIEDYGELSRLTGRKSGISEPVINLITKNNLKQSKQLQMNAGAGNNNKHNYSLGVVNLNSNNQFYAIGHSSNINDLTVNNQNKNDGYMAFFGNSLKYDYQANGIWVKTTTNYKSDQSIQTLTPDGYQFSYNNTENESTIDTKNINLSGNYKSPNTSINFIARNSFTNTNEANKLLSTQNGIQSLMQTSSNNSSSYLYTLEQGLDMAYSLKRKGRLLTLSERLIINDKNEHLKNDNLIEYYYPNNTKYDSTLNQTIKRRNNDFKFSTQISIIEPLNEKSDLALTYNFQSSSNSNNVETFFNTKDIGPVLIDSLSSALDYLITRHDITFSFRLHTSKTDLTLGATLSPYLIRVNPQNSQAFSITDFILSPVLLFQYKLNKSAVVLASINTNLIYPGIDQIQIVPDRTNIQYPIFGNPSLKGQKNYQTNLEIRHTGIMTLFFNIKPELNINKIVTNVILKNDSIGNFYQETHYLNTNSNYNIQINAGASRQFIENVLRLSYNFSYSFGNNIFFLNNIKNESKISNFSQSLKINIIKNWIELTSSLSHSYTRNIYLDKANSSTNFNTFIPQLDFKLYFLKNWTLGLNFKKQYYKGLKSSISSNPIMLGMSIEKKIQKDRFTFRLQGYNLVNEKNNFLQNINENTISETRNNLLGRFFLISITVNLKKTITKN